MSNVDTRQLGRDSLFLLAQLRVDGSARTHRVKVRNLSAGGMMADGDIDVSRGELVEIELRNIGWVVGTVAWKQENRVGIAFVEEIDSKLALTPQSDANDELSVPRHYKRHFIDTAADEKQSLRKL